MGGAPGLPGYRFVFFLTPLSSRTFPRINRGKGGVSLMQHYARANVGNIICWHFRLFLKSPPRQVCYNESASSAPLYHPQRVMSSGGMAPALQRFGAFLLPS
ncbi:hypothetical protein LCGC14_1767690 [marine sediment metagenome]|uniref:Uncharacterized protein n=1 Tax=marine sediment metagenome TaxID=412755 RepID=A0A0F9JE01_9ZZZZ